SIFRAVETPTDSRARDEYKRPPIDTDQARFARNRTTSASCRPADRARPPPLRILRAGELRWSLLHRKCAIRRCNGKRRSSGSRPALPQTQAARWHKWPLPERKQKKHKYSSCLPECKSCAKIGRFCFVAFVPIRMCDRRAGVAETTRMG